jgi:hypothetical protein
MQKASSDQMFGVMVQLHPDRKKEIDCQANAGIPTPTIDTPRRRSARTTPSSAATTIAGLLELGAAQCLRLFGSA